MGIGILDYGTISDVLDQLAQRARVEMPAICQRQLDIPMATIRNAHGGCVFACFRRSRPAAQKGLRRRAPSRGAVWGFPLDGAQAHGEAPAVAGAHLARVNAGFEHAPHFFLGEGFDGGFLDARRRDGFHDLRNP